MSLDRLQDALSGYGEQIKTYAIDRVDRDGVQVWIKTDLGKALKVYDSDTPAGTPSNAPSIELIKYGVQIRNRNGKVLTKYNEFPKTNVLKVAGLGVAALFSAYTVYKGLKGFI